MSILFFPVKIAPPITEIFLLNWDTLFLCIFHVGREAAHTGRIQCKKVSQFNKNISVMGGAISSITKGTDRVRKLRPSSLGNVYRGHGLMTHHGQSEDTFWTV